MEKEVFQKSKEKYSLDAENRWRALVARLRIGAPETVFTRLAEISAYARWKIIPRGEGFAAEADSCTLCALARMTGAPSPCRLYCLDALQGMAQALAPQSRFEVLETLWEGEKCRVEVGPEAGSQLP